MSDIVLAAINAKWIHPSLALRLLKANLGDLETSCEIIELNLRQPLREKLDFLLAANPKILGLSVSIWNHQAAIELLAALEKEWADTGRAKPVIVLGGPEVSYLSEDDKIFQYADYIIRGEGEISFRLLCEDLLSRRSREKFNSEKFINRKFIKGEENPALIKSAYHLYTDEDTAKKLIYVESGRGCPFKCDFCLSSLNEKIYEFPLEPFLAEMDKLIQRGVKTFKFLDRSFNVNIKRALKIMEFFLSRLEMTFFTVHFEMVPSIFPDELMETLALFPSGTLRLEIGLQTLNSEVSARINRPSNPDKELETLRLLMEKTNAIIHADLIAGLPGESLESFGKGFDLLRLALKGGRERAEIQLGILKKLPGSPISRHDKTFGMRYNPLPPYEIEENVSISATDLLRLKNFSRFWVQIIDRGLLIPQKPHIFEKFLSFSDELYAHFGKNWGIDRAELLQRTKNVIL